MTYRELLQRLNTLTEEQLDMDVICIAEGFSGSGKVNSVEVMPEDQVNPSGDGWEDISACGLSADGLIDEPICAHKDQPVIMFE
jgi:hypothetical protein